MKIKNWKMKTGVVLSTLLLLATATIPNALAFSVAQSGYNQDGISVDVKQINELADNNLFADESTPSQALAQTLATMVSKDPSGDNGNFTEVLSAKDVLQYFYPNASEKELEGTGITPVQGVEWLNFKGYTATIIDRPLTTSEIKKHLDNSEPIVTVLENQNAESWLNQHYAGVLYAHDDVETGIAEGRLHASFIKSINYGEASINDGEEANAFKFADMANSPDPIQAESTFKWISTITEIKRDPSWTNSQTIQEDKAKGVFEHKVTSDGTQSQVDFTDPEVSALLNKYPIENKEHVLKLTAVSLINLYEDKAHQKTVKDLEEFLKISSSTYATTQNIIDWYKYLGFDFDVVNGRAPMALTKSLNDSGRLYLTMFKAQDNANPVKNTAAIGAGYLNNSFNGYSPYWYAVKLGENTVPFYNVPLTTAGMKQQQELAKKFQYTNVKRVVSDPFSKTDYEEEKTIYNIRLKGIPDESGITSKPDESVETPPVESHVTPPINANYIQAEDFNIRETQGQQPWCTSYVAAGAVNTTSKAPMTDEEEKGAITTAKKIMQLDRPGVSDEELQNLPGTTIDHMLEVIQKNYQTTATVEARPLSFAEVKKEIDAGGIISMDGYNSEDPEGPGNGGKGHEVAIVGYVESIEAGKAPYYIVWNPWWDSTFYLSSQAETFNLGGVKYKWYRTWHNWRKTNSRMTENLEPELGNQQVESTANPYQSKESPSLELGIIDQDKYDLLDFGEHKDIINQNVDKQGRPIYAHDGFSGADYSYWIGYHPNGHQFMSATRTGQEKTVDYNATAKQFKGSVDKLIEYQTKVVGAAVSTALTAVAMALAYSIPGVNALAAALSLAFGGIMDAASLNVFAENVLLYHQASDETTRLFNVL